MKHLRILMISLALSLIAATGFAYPVEAGDYVTFKNGDFGTTSGGEFQVYDWETGAYLYASFCLEKDEYINYSDKFVVDSISERAFGGGRDKTDKKDGDPISDATKWLYWNFANGTLEEATGSKYSYSDAGINALQTAFWLLEDEIPNTKNNLAGELVRLAKEAVAGGADLGDVMVMNISFTNGRDAQSQLIAGPAPVPEPATLVLLGSGLAGLAFYRRRK